MNAGSVRLAWLLLAVWCVWLVALQGRLAGGLGPWTPDVGLALCLALGARLSGPDIARAALIVALARIAVSVDPPAAVLAGYLGAALAARTVQGVVALESALVRSLLGLLLAPTMALWLFVAHAARERGLGDVSPVLFAPPWRAALSTALLAGPAAPVLVRLPGLTPLRRRRSWHTAVSYT